MKKFVSILLAVMLVFALAVSASAATIEVKEVIDGEEYTAYKILNYTTDGEDAYSYYLTAAEYASIGAALETAGFVFKQSADKTQYVVTNAETIDIAAAAASLASANLGDALGKFGPVAGANGKASFTGLTQGYYFVTTTAGSICALHSETDIATAVEKNTVTVPDKKQGAVAGTYSDDQLDLNIGDTVYYDAEITIGKGANYAMTGTDVLSEGLTLNQNSITVKVGTTDVAAANYTLTTTAQGFKIVFTASYVSSLNENDVIKIEYSAVINENAAIATEIPNTFDLDYSKQHFEDKTVVKTYDVNLKKSDGTNALAGAEFNLYTAQTGGTALTFKKDTTGYYLDATGEVKIEAGDGTGVNIRGLAPGDYWFEETVAPNGYNKLDARVKVTVSKDQTATAEITVINNAGTELPSTGGIGTTIFYIVGGLLIVAAGILLITKKRMSRES